MQTNMALYTDLLYMKLLRPNVYWRYYDQEENQMFTFITFVPLHAEYWLSPGKMLDRAALKYIPQGHSPI